MATADELEAAQGVLEEILGPIAKARSLTLAMLLAAEGVREYERRRLAQIACEALRGGVEREEG